MYLLKNDLAFKITCRYTKKVIVMCTNDYEKKLSNDFLVHFITITDINKS